MRHMAAVLPAVSAIGGAPASARARAGAALPNAAGAAALRAALPGQTRQGCLSRRRLAAARDRLACSSVSSDGEGVAAGDADADVDDASNRTVYIKRTLRGGQIEDHPGAVVVCGDVNRGSMVVAGGDIIIWGRLRGEAHAGKLGNRSATIMALDMEPTQLRIADKIAYGPEEGSSPEYPELAQLGGDGMITVVPAGHVGLQTTEERAARRARLTSSGSSKDSWTPGARTSRFTGVYIGLVGLALLLAPAKVFSVLFDLRMVSTGWVQVGGVLATAFGINYLVTAYGDAMGAGARSYYVSTVVSRVFIFVAFGLLVALRCVQPQLLVLGALNLVGAASMFSALNKP